MNSPDYSHETDTDLLSPDNLSGRVVSICLRLGRKLCRATGDIFRRSEEICFDAEENLFS